MILAPLEEGPHPRPPSVRGIRERTPVGREGCGTGAQRERDRISSQGWIGDGFTQGEGGYYCTGDQTDKTSCRTPPDLIRGPASGRIPAPGFRGDDVRIPAPDPDCPVLDTGSGFRRDDVVARELYPHAPPVGGGARRFRRVKRSRYWELLKSAALRLCLFSSV
jgi:hypothetical protein